MTNGFSGSNMKRPKKSDALPVAPPATGGTVPPRIPTIVRNDFVVSRLRVGDVILLDSRRHVVEMVNECRARAVPVAKKRVDYETVAGKRVKFDTNFSSQNISPNSECKIVQRLGPDWRSKLKE